MGVSLKVTCLGVTPGNDGSCLSMEVGRAHKVSAAGSGALGPWLRAGSTWPAYSALSGLKDWEQRWIYWGWMDWKMIPVSWFEQVNLV